MYPKCPEPVLEVALMLSSKFSFSPGLPRGFTLIELLVTVAIVSILMMVAVPSFSDIRRNSELSGAANGLLAAVNMARTEGMKRNMNSLVIPKSKDNNWNAGWLVFIDVDRDGLFDTTKGDLLVVEGDAPASYLSITANGGTGAENPSYLLFDGSGFHKDKTGGFGGNTLTIRRTDVDAARYNQVRRMKVARTGRTRVCTPVSASDNACKETGEDT